MIPSNFQNEIQELLDKGLRPKQIAEKLTLNPVSTNDFIRRKLGYSFSRTYKIEHPDYFNTIDTHMKAYWLGWMASDGYLTNNPSKVIGIQLSEKDSIVVEKFKEQLGSERPILTIKERILEVNGKTYIGKPLKRFTVGNKQLFDDLTSLGVTTNKSLTLTNILQNIPYKYRDSFIVGYIDGDGSYMLPKGKVKPTNNKYYPSHSVVVQIRGTKDLLQGIKTHLNLDNPIDYNKTFTLKFSSKWKIIRLVKCYNNLNFFLKRKHDILIKRLNHTSFHKLIQAQTISSPFPYKGE